MRKVRVAVVRETREGEARVALVPELVEKLTALGYVVAVEPGAGASALHGFELLARERRTLQIHLKRRQDLQATGKCDGAGALDQRVLNQRAVLTDQRVGLPLRGHR